MEAVRYSIVILAAGSSSRLGTPKQLLKIGKKTLIARLAEEAAAVSNVQVVIVTGSSAPEVEGEVSHVPCHTIHNAQWADGMGGSVVTGLKKSLQINAKIEGVLLAVCDQPFVTRNLLQSMLGLAGPNPAGIVACSYAGTLGTPVLFPKPYFAELLSLSGTEGAKKILKRHPAQIIPLDFPQGAMDIDTPADYERFIYSQN